VITNHDGSIVETC